MKKALVCGGGGFIGWHLTKKLKEENFWVKAVDIRYPEFETSPADEFVIGDLSDTTVADAVIDQKYDHVYQLAAVMGGAGYINNGEHDAIILEKGTRINLNVLDSCVRQGITKVFFSSSACVYNGNLRPAGEYAFKEEHAYPSIPENEYGWGKLFSERIFLSYNRYYGMQNKIARFHNIFGENGCFDGGKEKAFAAMCRKVALSDDHDAIEIWGDGSQSRSFLHVSDCVNAVYLLMESDFSGPVNIGGDHMISLDELVDIVCEVAGKNLTKKYVPGPLSIDKRNSDNSLVTEKLGWSPTIDIRSGVERTYRWIAEQIRNNK